MNRRRRAPRRGFTIIEILVATLLLATSLVAIFGAQFAAVAGTNYARNLTAATQLGKCRMSEIELLILEEGFQEGSVVESGPCCEFMEGETLIEFNCEWEIEEVEFPDMPLTGDEDGEGLVGENGSFTQSLLGGSGGAIGQGLGSSTMDDMAQMGLGMVSELLEQAIRKVTVRVSWKEGIATKDFVLVQYVTHPSQGPLKLMQEASAAEDLQSTLQNAIPGISPGGSRNSGGGRSSGGKN